MREGRDLEDLDWIVIPGGPGLSSEYLKLGLSSLQPFYKLHFFDLLGAPDSVKQNDVSINDLLDQILDVVSKKHLKKYGIIAHSFGSYLAMRLLDKAPENICALILLSPMPLLFDDWQKAITKVGSSLPEELLNKLNAPDENDKEGIELFNELMPYYVKKHVPKLKVPFCINSCSEISGQVNDYDDRNLLQTTSVPWRCIAGKGDLFFIDDTIFRKHATILQGVGHYPFLEDENSFLMAFKQLWV